ncbi:MAG: hypothetical protein QM747_10320 [Nocardioides sp.]
MKLFTLVLGALALVAGAAGGLRAYNVASASPSTPLTVASADHGAAPVRPGVVLRWAPCRKPAVRVGRECVTHVVRTVTLPAPVVTVAPTSSSTHAVPTRVPHPSHAPTQAPSDPPSDDGGHDRHHGDDGDDGSDDGGDGGGDGRWRRLRLVAERAAPHGTSGRATSIRTPPDRDVPVTT